MIEIHKVPYKQISGPPQTAAIIPVSLDLTCLSSVDLQVLSYLCEAVDMMNKVHWKLSGQSMFTLVPVLSHMLESENLSPEEKTAIENYRTVLFVQNMPYSRSNEHNHILDLPKDRVLEIMKSVGISEQDQSIVLPYFFEDCTLDAKRFYYPEDFTQEDALSLPPEAKQPNTRVIRKDGKVTTVPYEIICKEECAQIVEKLRQARAICPNFSFKLYLDAKITELLTGTQESRNVADTLWIAHDYHIDLILSTAVESYMDSWGLKAAPYAAVFVKDSSLDSFVSAISKHFPTMEAEAPSPYFRRSGAPPTRLVQRPVNVVTWSSDYVQSPLTFLAQNLPNSQEIKTNYGCVNSLFVNVVHASKKASTIKPTVFLPRKDLERLGDAFAYGYFIHFMLHEVGHLTGLPADPSMQNVDASTLLGPEVHVLEEMRAEVFGLYGAINCMEHGIISKEVATGAHYQLLLMCITSLSSPPAGTYPSARNMIIHYLMKHGAVKFSLEEEEEIVRPDGTTTTCKLKKFEIVEEKMKETVYSLLTIVQDIKSRMDKDAATKLRNELCYDDENREDICQRMSRVSYGRGFVFPRLMPPSAESPSPSPSSVSLPGGWTLEYPKSFSDQPMFKL